VGFRIEEEEGIRFLAEKLARAGVAGADVGELKRRGSVQTANGVVRLDEVTAPRPGNAFAFVMDTRPCPGALALAKGADLLVMEATYTSEHQELADFYGHSTARDAAGTAASAGVRKLALAHFSQRYPDTGGHVTDACAVFPDVMALKDFDRIEILRGPER
jgi:ribonuclease Z